MSDETQGQQPEQPGTPPSQPEQPSQQPGTPPPNWQQPPGAAANPDPHGLGPTSVGMAPHVAGALSYVFFWITGLIFFLSEKTNRFVRFHAMQSIVLHLAFHMLIVIFYILMLVVIGGAAASSPAAAGAGAIVVVVGCLFWILWLAYVILWIVCIIQAATGKWFKLPLIGDFAAKQAGV